jgi:hypothetical protein
VESIVNQIKDVVIKKVYPNLIELYSSFQLIYVEGIGFGFYSENHSEETRLKLEIILNNCNNLLKLEKVCASNDADFTSEFCNYIQKIIKLEVLAQNNYPSLYTILIKVINSHLPNSESKEFCMIEIAEFLESKSKEKYHYNHQNKFKILSQWFKQLSMNS